MAPDIRYFRKETEEGSQERGRQSSLPRRELLKTGIAAGLSLTGISKSGVGKAQTGGGTEQWRFQTESSVVASPTVVNGTVYVGSGDGNLYALAADDGSEQWRFRTSNGVDSAAMVVGGTVYVGSEDGYLSALDADDGTEQWRFQVGSAPSSPTVVDDTVYIGSGDGDVYAVAADDGTEQWGFQIGSSASSLAVANGTVYAGDFRTNLTALAADDGTRRWRSQVGRGVDGSPTVVNDTVYISGGLANVYALAVDDGTEKWRFDTNELAVYTTPTVANGTVYIGYEANELLALAADDGTKQWGYGTTDYIVGSPTVANGTVFAGGRGNNVYAVAASNGTEQWRFETGDVVASPPIVADGTVYVGSIDGNVYALDAGVDGASDGSRALLGTLGHHGNLAFDDDSGPDDAESLLEIVATGEGEISYEFVIEGSAEKTTVSEKIKSEPGGNDEINRRDSDTVVIEGFTGNTGFGDAYLIDGEIVDFRRIDGSADVEIRLDGETVPPSEFSDGSDDTSTLLEIVSTEEGEISYEVVVEGSARKTTVSEKIKSEPGGNDQIRRLDSNTVVIEGFTGNTGFGDAYLIDGRIVDFRRIDGDVDITVRLDGEPIAPDQL